MFDPHPDIVDQPVNATDALGSGSRPRSASDASLLDMHSIEIKPLTRDELRELREVGRERRSFDGLAKEILRLRFVSAVMPPLEDPEALRGLRRRERALLLEAFAAGTTGSDELRMGALLSRCVPDDGDNLVAMLSTALEFDCMRQELLAERRYADASHA